MEEKLWNVGMGWGGEARRNDEVEDSGCGNPGNICITKSHLEGIYSLGHRHPFTFLLLNHLSLNLVHKILVCWFQLSYFHEGHVALAWPVNKGLIALLRHGRAHHQIGAKNTPMKRESKTLCSSYQGRKLIFFPVRLEVGILDWSSIYSLVRGGHLRMKLTHTQESRDELGDGEKPHPGGIFLGPGQASLASGN